MLLLVVVVGDQIWGNPALDSSDSPGKKNGPGSRSQSFDVTSTFLWLGSSLVSSRAGDWTSALPMKREATSFSLLAERKFSMTGATIAKKKGQLPLFLSLLIPEDFLHQKVS